MSRERQECHPALHGRGNNDDDGWLEKPAISWVAPSSSSSSSSSSSLETKDESTDQPHCVYWDDDLIIGEMRSLGHRGNDEGRESSSYSSSSIDYESLIIAASLMEPRLRRLMRDCVAMMHPPETRDPPVGIPIAVAIPEGFLLPLAVLSVHALNEPAATTKTTTTTSDLSHRNEDLDDHCCCCCCCCCYGVLVPIEPGEGFDRLVHIIRDVNPGLILCMPGHDWHKLGKVVAEASQPNGQDEGRRRRNRKNKTPMVRHGVYQTQQPIMVDFRELVLSCIREAKSHRIVEKISRQLRNEWFCRDKPLNDVVGRMKSIIDDERENEGHATAEQPREHNRISHIVYTSGTTGMPKGCVSSAHALRHYLTSKNETHGIDVDSKVLLASALSFDPCLSDILATLEARATLVMTSRSTLVQGLSTVLRRCHVTHVLCTPTLWGMVQIADLPSLRVIALGGEPIPRRIVESWARRRTTTRGESSSSSSVRLGLALYATYGVTEACVYQTMGEVFRDEPRRPLGGQDVGKPFRGLGVRICKEEGQKSDDGDSDATRLVDVDHDGVEGEVVLFGNQLDELSGYWNREGLSRAKFVRDMSTTFYRTGDRGAIDPETRNLVIGGRIDGEDGMVKINGVRIELGEVEAALVDPHGSNSDLPVVDCLAMARHSNPNDGDSPKQVHAFLVLGPDCKRELRLEESLRSQRGILCSPGPLHTLLRDRCARRLRAAAMPVAFVLLRGMPLSPTGKCDRRRLPLLSDCATMDHVLRDGDSKMNAIPLWEYGISGAVVANEIVDCLNLQQCQKVLVTTGSNFARLGGESLSATRLVRSLYAYHHDVFNSRHLGGSLGALDGPFAVVHLLKAPTLREYVDLLDSHNVCALKGSDGDGKSESDRAEEGGPVDSPPPPPSPRAIMSSEEQRATELYDALLQATSLGQTSIAVALLDGGTDPNWDHHGGRLSKVGHRHERKKKFRSNPLHLACRYGNATLVKKLLERGCKLNSPDPSGLFPLHLAASGTTVPSSSSPPSPSSSHGDEDGTLSPQELRRDDERRREIVKLLLEYGAPLSMKDGNKQTVLHCASRAGHALLLSFLLVEWKRGLEAGTIKYYDDKHKGGEYDWLDHWYRTPVHWAVLNGKAEALRLLLEGGCSADPPGPSSRKGQLHTSAKLERPIEICRRLYGEDDAIGKQISAMLRAKMISERTREER